MFCSSCGTDLPEGTAFCTGCGRKQVSEAPAPAPSPVAAPNPNYAPEQLPVYGQPHVQQPVYVSVERAPSNGCATAGMVLGIVGLPFSLFSWALWVLAIPSVVGIILSIVGLVLSTRHSLHPGRGKAIAGLIMSGISLFLIFIVFVSCASIFGYYNIYDYL